MSRLEFAYDTAYDPPAPVVEIWVEGVAGARERCRALVDPSATVSCVPSRILDVIRAPDTGEVKVTTFLGDTGCLRKRKVTVLLGTKQAKLEVLPLARDVALLGRDFLNGCVVVLDGRAQKVCVED